MSNDKSLNNVNNAEMIFSPKVMVQNFVPTIADKTQYLFKAVHSNEDIKFNGEDFSLVHLNGNHLASNSKNNNKMNFAGGHVRVLAINKEEKKENEMEDVLSNAFLGAIFGGFGYLLKYAVKAGESAEMLESNVKTKRLDSIININPKAAIDPSLAFRPASPFMIEKKPIPELWQQRREKSKEKEAEAKRKKYKMVKGI